MDFAGKFNDTRAIFRISSRIKKSCAGRKFEFEIETIYISYTLTSFSISRNANTNNFFWYTKKSEFFYRSYIQKYRVVDGLHENFVIIEEIKKMFHSFRQFKR